MLLKDVARWIYRDEELANKEEDLLCVFVEGRGIIDRESVPSSAGTSLFAPCACTAVPLVVSTLE